VPTFYADKKKETNFDVAVVACELSFSLCFHSPAPILPDEEFASVFRDARRVFFPCRRSDAGVVV